MAIVDSSFFARFAPYWRSHDGRAVLLHGDALELMPDLTAGSVDCVWTDPPYLLSNGGISCSAGRRVSVDKGEWDKSNGLEQDMQFCESWVAECKRVLTPAGCIWVSGTLHIHPIVGVSLLKSGFRILNDIIWEKPNPPPNLGCRTFTHSTELIYWATAAPKDSGQKYTFNYGDMKLENGGKQMKTVWQYTAPRKDEKRHGNHNTQKPVDLVSRCLRASTRPDDLVLDPFVGSGSTGVAAMQLGRRFIGIDADERFLKTAALRLAEVTPPPPPPTNIVIYQMDMVVYRHHTTTHMWARLHRGTITATCVCANPARKGTGEGWSGRRHTTRYAVWSVKICGNSLRNTVSGSGTRKGR